jgi:Uma2 family endonuclease
VEYEARTRRWTRAEYEQLITLGMLHEDEPIELIGGVLRVCDPQGSSHMVAVGLATDVLRAAFGTGWAIRVQGPVALDDDSEPEPDVAVVRGTHRDYLAGHPARPALVLEVADASLAIDRELKGSLYARAGLADYWIVNLMERVLEVYRVPDIDAAAPFGWRYARRDVFDADQAVSPAAAPAASIRVADLLP